MPLSPRHRCRVIVKRSTSAARMLGAKWYAVRVPRVLYTEMGETINRRQRGDLALRVASFRSRVQPTVPSYIQCRTMDIHIKGIRGAESLPLPLICRMHTWMPASVPGQRVASCQLPSANRSTVRSCPSPAVNWQSMATPSRTTSPRTLTHAGQPHVSSAGTDP